MDLVYIQGAMDPLFVSESFRIEDRGTAAVFEHDPVPPWPWRPHVVRVTTPNGHQLKTTAHVEWVRKSSGDVMALLFPDLEVSQLPAGSTIDRIDEEVDRGGL
jgi:hypothetical protein